MFFCTSESPAHRKKRIILPVISSCATIAGTRFGCSNDAPAVLFRVTYLGEVHSDDATFLFFCKTLVLVIVIGGLVTYWNSVTIFVWAMSRTIPSPPLLDIP